VKLFLYTAHFHLIGLPYKEPSKIQQRTPSTNERIKVLNIKLFSSKLHGKSGRKLTGWFKSKRFLENTKNRENNTKIVVFSAIVSMYQYRIV
jgi:hypothetical protein